MKILELFKGTGSVGKVAEKLGWDVVSLDIEEKYKPTICEDFLTWNYKKLKFTPDIIWASPPCTTWSKMTHKHRTIKEGLTAKTEEAKIAEHQIIKLLDVIQYFKPQYWFIENPRGRLRYFPYMSNLPKYTVYYGAYDWHFRKETDIWTNIKGFDPRPLDKTKKFNKVKYTSSLAEKYAIPPLLIEDLLSFCK
jgi:site-specific DNA-cytosine methylase